MTPRDLKEITKRLRSIDKKHWDLLSNEERTHAIERYDELTNLRRFRTSELVESLLNRSDSIYLIAAAIVFGISGSLVANMFDRVFVKYGGIYDFVIAVFFVSVMYGLPRLADLVITRGYRENDLLTRLLKENE